MFIKIYNIIFCKQGNKLFFKGKKKKTFVKGHVSKKNSFYDSEQGFMEDMNKLPINKRNKKLPVHHYVFLFSKNIYLIQ